MAFFRCLVFAPFYDMNMFPTPALFDGYTFVLASQSPRRKELLELLNIPVKVWNKPIDEVYPPELMPEQVPIYLAELKSKAFDQEPLGQKEILITADTVVICEETILNKPKNREEAIACLRKISDNRHRVITGCCIGLNHRRQTFNVVTDVYFKPLSEEEIIYYVDYYNPYDKAGAYGVQEWIGCIGVERIEGSFYNVVGLPLQRLYSEVCKMLQSQS